MKPEFICIGAQKAGTSWLYNQFCHHPEFAMLPIKELHYFDRSPEYLSPNTLSNITLIQRLSDKSWRRKVIKDFAKSIYYRQIKLMPFWSRYHFATYTDRWYLSLFENQKGITGDITPSYSILQECDVKRLYETAPKAKILFLLRNPIDRAWSMVRFDATRSGKELNVDDVVTFSKHINSPDRRLRGDYLRTIDLYLKYYRSEDFLIGFYDALVSEPHNFLRAIYRHIGCRDIDYAHGNIHQKVNSSIYADIPDGFRELLCDFYHDDIVELSHRVGSYANEWVEVIGGPGQSWDAVRTNGLSPVVYI